MDFSRRWTVGLMALLTACSTGYAFDPTPGADQGGGAGGGADDPSDPGDPGDPGGGDADGGTSGDICPPITFESELTRAPVDIIIAVDSSGSMGDEAQRVQGNLNRFSMLAKQSGTDHRIVMLTRSSFVTVPAPLGTDPTRYRFIETPVESTDAMLYMMSEYPRYKDFLRPNAKTHFVVVSDDNSTVSARCFKELMEQVLGHPFQYHSIVSEHATGQAVPSLDAAPECSCTEAGGAAWIEAGDLNNVSACTADFSGFAPFANACGGAASPGQVHRSLTEATDGLFVSICTADWTAAFDQLLKEVTESSIPCQFDVPEPPGGFTFEPADIQLAHTAPVGGRRALKRASSAACTDGDWYLAGGAGAGKIQLCQASCNTVTEQGGTLEMDWECAGVVY